MNKVCRLNLTACTLVLLSRSVLASPQTSQSAVKSSAPQPYEYLNGGKFVGGKNPYSPDPIFNYHWNQTANDDPLQIFELRPKVAVAFPPTIAKNLTSLTTPNPNVEISGSGSIRLDFGVETGSWIEFDSPDCPGNVEMSISEYNEPGVDKTNRPEKIGNTYRLKLNDELYDGVRFAWIHVKSPSKPWHITGIRAVCQIKPTNYTGSFSSNDPMLNRIWYTAAYGVRASLCKDYFGSILMDRGDRISWTGDAHPAQAAALVAFSNYDFIRKNLENTSKQDNGIRSYSLIWVLSLLDYYRYTGDTATLDKFTSNATKKLDSAYQVFGTNPDLRFYGWDDRVGGGFEIWFRKNQESQNAYKMLSIRVWREFSEAMEQRGNKELAAKYAKYARTKVAEVNQDPLWHSNYSIHAASDAINTGLLTYSIQETLFNREFKDRVNRLSISPFNQYFILQSLATMNKWDEALTSVNDMWGEMIRYGGTTTFEVFRPSWNQIISKNDAVPNSQCGIVSLCHPWGAGVAKWLTEQILGLSPTSPGFTTFRFAPHFGTKLTNVSGSVNTPKGTISAKMDLSKGTAELHCPQGTTGSIEIPRSNQSLVKLTLDGKVIVTPSPTTDQVLVLPDRLVITNIQPGKHSLQFTPVNSNQFRTTADPLTYPAKLVSTDKTTQGNWSDKYGKDGYILLGAKQDDTDESALPTYVKSIDFFRAFPKPGRPDTTIWDSQTNDKRALAPSRLNQFPRRATCLSNNDQTMTFSVWFKNPAKHRITLYFVDWKKSGSRSDIEMFDADTLRMIAPVSMVKDHQNGLYLTYETKQSTKFRLNKIRGELVTLSGIFFD